MNIIKKIIKITVASALAFSMIAAPAFASENHNTLEVVETTEAAAEETVWDSSDIPSVEDLLSLMVEVPDRYNIVLFGLSFPDESDKDRSDSIILVTIDNVNKQLKFTSILRDTKAQIEGHEPQKLNAAYQIGGAGFAVKTLNENFGLDLEDYITVTFEEYVEIIDLIGGVDVTLTQAEADYINENCGGQLTEGLQHLNGAETLDYSRIRKLDSDVERSARQRNVLKYLVEQIPQMSTADFLTLTIKFLQIVETSSLDFSDLAALAMIPYGEYTIINNHVPDYDYETDVEGGIDEHGEWVWTYDLAAAGERINDIIYNAQSVQE